MSDDKMRQEFEAWAKASNYCLTTWQVWQAAYQAGRKAEQAEVERLRFEVYFHSEACKGLIAELAEKKAENDKLRAELAAAKAASVWPVGWAEIRTNPGGNVVIYTNNHEIAFQLMAWLRDCMKERGEE